MKVRLLLGCLFVSLYVGIGAEFNPLLNVESCTKDKLIVSTYNAAQDGLIYIMGQGENCRQQTVDGVGMYEFDFQQCGIQWEMLFKIVIQKKQGYQTGADKQIPIFCIADRDDLIVSNTNNAQDKNDDGSLNMTVKPSAYMTFYKVVSDEEVMGKEVKLTDTLIMALQMDDQWTDGGKYFINQDTNNVVEKNDSKPKKDFDIKARYCVASEIVIIENFCATDPDLFPNFSKLRTGYLVSEFGAFRSTSLEGGSVEMNFTCILQVCKDECEETDCSGTPGWGRKKREINHLVTHEERVISHDLSHREKRQADVLDIDVGGKVNIVEKYSEIQVVTNETLCINAAMFIIIIVFLAAGVLGFGGMSAILYRKWIDAQALSAKLQMKSNSSTRQPQLESTSQHQVRKFSNPFNEPSFDAF